MCNPSIVGIISPLVSCNADNDAQDVVRLNRAYILAHQRLVPTPRSQRTTAGSHSQGCPKLLCQEEAVSCRSEFCQVVHRCAPPSLDVWMFDQQSVLPAHQAHIWVSVSSFTPHPLAYGHKCHPAHTPCDGLGCLTCQCTESGVNPTLWIDGLIVHNIHSRPSVSTHSKFQLNTPTSHLQHVCS
jgi:hypothetical protein